MTSTKNVVLVLLVVLASAGTGLATLSDGLVAYYPFNGNPSDASGNGHDGAEYGGPSYVPGPIGQAIRFDGVDDWVHATCPDIIVGGTQPSFAISFWFKPTVGWTPVSTLSHGKIVGNIDHDVSDDWHTGDSGWSALGRLEFDLHDEPYPSPGVVLYTITNTWNADTWYHVAYSHDAATRVFSVWVNGVLENSTTIPEDVGLNWAGQHLSMARYDSLYTDMTFDELRLYNRALSSEEIRSLATIPVPVPGAVILAGIGLGFANWRLRRRRMV